MLRLVSLSLLWFFSTSAWAHPNGLPHHFFTDVNTPHSALLGSGLYYLIGAVVATAIFFVLRWLGVIPK